MDYSLVPMYNKGLFNSSNLELKELKKIKEIKTFEFLISNALFVPIKRIVFNFFFFSLNDYQSFYSLRGL